MSEALFEILVPFLQHLVLALLTLGALLALAQVVRHRPKERPALVPVRRTINHPSRDTDIRIPVSSGISTRYPTRGPPIERPLRPDDDPDRSNDQ